MYAVMPARDRGTSKWFVWIFIPALFASCDAWFVALRASPVIDLRAQRNKVSYGSCLRHEQDRIGGVGRDVHVGVALRGRGDEGIEEDAATAATLSPSFEEWQEYFLRNNLGDPSTASTSWEAESSRTGSSVGTKVMTVYISPAEHCLRTFLGKLRPCTAGKYHDSILANNGAVSPAPLLSTVPL